MRIEPELGGCGIVLVGHFNPLIFSPAWFAKNGIVSDEEANSAEVSVIHPEISAFRIGKMRLQVEQLRLSADTTEAPWITLCDFLVKTFGEFLVHTPINGMGINRSVHFSVGDEETRNRIGRLIAPLGPWREWGREIENQGPGARSGCTNLTMVQPKVAEDDINGHIQLQVQPSSRLRGNAGIFVSVNDHYSVGGLEQLIGCEKIISILSERFERSIRGSEDKIDIVMAMKELL
ncbi:MULTISPECIES: hypothetical protein [unclassified Bradyrhizobium]|uniref:hypothetical protein n=1 Tax=unclassified Bradyrhizobium TaxID=2631580 RepID=UPI001BA8586A|nr:MULTISPECIES: hypothetical protein [unclassified Bradyrhizobium]WLA52395.1 hypothetical protein QIH80_21245 [Bradyrhizobium elkanii]MBR1206941.1 hypothetical protein [Bradyrhizobium sp. AUGA SZCCT0124]MBR1313480.1 hypothetical protein [Bradyrhizobium sp. AUGA SZCCT0051]MBR1343423.1 hypothetical protein [Bradyrhizobium sp. AUGA SZCCT0105]MBR1357157.1 hypothetical protein [Bradyrhizobium sp. AUGA SZCCT0045]